MSLKKEIAGAIRAIRTTRGLDYGDLAEVSVKANIGNLEQGRSSITLEKLIELSDALQFDPVALLAICLATHKDEPYVITLSRARDQLDAFQAEGGLELLRGQLVGKELVKRPRGKPGNTQGAEAVKALKAAGFSQAEAAEKLGLAKSTVHRYWHS
ncbi:helix-turn-helix domain-containing protein [Pseudomonas sp. BE134]|uniref:helix-turn-helix domain-containing protein n=1 Tax=Pseudomonas sp. BE134 TaxID=2817843 RepID=UPI0028575C8A|nr:helix-turn-helix domain-containing protein [Pseudomonas sp. BE134]MDR6925937.1 transcriptional regulator with XRE-family HTH domain [Pseudomonas sp. BE134]